MEKTCSLYMVIDIGSNTVKYSCYRVGTDGTAEKTGGQAVTVRLLRYIREGALTREGVERLCGVLGAFKDEAERDGVEGEHLLCFATAGFRRLGRPEAVIDEILVRTGVFIRLLTGEEEAALSFRGMLLTAAPRPVAGLMLDMGGGSTERILFENGEPTSAVSRAFGALSLYGDFVKGEFPSEKEAAAIRAYVRETMAAAMPKAAPIAPDGQRLACIVGGTAKAVAALNPETEDPGRRFSVDAFRRQLGGYLAGRELGRMQEEYPDRYRVIVPGMLAYDEIFALAGITRVQVAEGGLRDGVLWEFLQGARERGCGK